MTQPLALILYERLLPGTQLVNRLQDLGYRVQTVHDPALLISTAEQEKPLIVLTDLESAKANVSTIIAQLKQHATTKHLPVVAFASDEAAELKAKARDAGAVVTDDAALLQHLAQVLDQALQLD